MVQIAVTTPSSEAEPVSRLDVNGCTSRNDVAASRRLKALDHVWQIEVRQTVAVIHEKHLLAHST
jgi:hypothetical protein